MSMPLSLRKHPRSLRDRAHTTTGQNPPTTQPMGGFLQRLFGRSPTATAALNTDEQPRVAEEKKPTSKNDHPPTYKESQQGEQDDMARGRSTIFTNTAVARPSGVWTPEPRPPFCDERVRRMCTAAFDLASEDISRRYPQSAHGLVMRLHIGAGNQIWGHFDLGFCHGFMRTSSFPKDLADGREVRFSCRSTHHLFSEARMPQYECVLTLKEGRLEGHFTIPDYAIANERGYVMGWSFEFTATRQNLPDLSSGRAPAFYSIGWERTEVCPALVR